MFAKCDGFKSTLEMVAVQPGVTTTVDTLHLDDGRHDVTPASGDWMSRADLGDVLFTHHDPDGLAGLGWIPFVFLELPNGGFWNVTANGRQLIEVDQFDDHTLALRLDGRQLLRLLGDPDELALWWVVAETATGKVRAADGIYRFAD
jgi:hypothetical protein